MKVIAPLTLLAASASAGRIQFRVEGNDLWGYDGGFYPSPEVYIKTFVNGREWIRTHYKNTAHPTLDFFEYLPKNAEDLRIELWDHDTEGSHDKMCWTSTLNIADLDLRQRIKMKCMHKGTATAIIEDI